MTSHPNRKCPGETRQEWENQLGNAPEGMDLLRKGEEKNKRELKP